MSFPPGKGAPPEVTLDELRSLSEHPESGVAYFAGIATYRIDFNAHPPALGQRLWLDLGEVQVSANLRLNGEALGVVWRAPYCVDITDVVRDGQNSLEVEVATRWVNRLIGDENLPPDSERHEAGPDLDGRNPGSLKAWPRWVLENGKSSTGRIAFSTWNLYRKGDPLVASGLVGPVKLVLSNAPLTDTMQRHN